MLLIGTQASDLSTILTPRICELGKIKIGGKSEQVRKTQSGGEWRAPEKYDHFVITSLHREDNGNLARDDELMASLKAGYASPDGKIRQIPITLLSNTPEDVMQSAYVCYSGKRVAARSDGRTLIKYMDVKTKEVLAEPQKSEWQPALADAVDGKGVKYFKLHTTFNCVIASGDSRWGGVYKFRTTSQITASQLYGSLLMLKQLTGGVLVGLPLRLVVRPMQVSPQGKTTTIYVVHVELRGEDIKVIQRMAVDIARFQLEHATEMQRTQHQMGRLLRGPGLGESDEEMADVQEEFVPEASGDVIDVEPVPSPQTPEVGNPEDLERELMGEATPGPAPVPTEAEVPFDDAPDEIPF